MAKPPTHVGSKITVVVLAIVLLSAGLFVLIELSRPHAVGTPFTHSIVNGLVTVNASGFKVYIFTIPSDAVGLSMGGNFTVLGNNNSIIRVYVMNQTNFANWQKGDTFSSYYTSGEATTGYIKAYPPAGGFYLLVFDNSFSTTSKNIDTDIYALYKPPD